MIEKVRKRDGGIVPSDQDGVTEPIWKTTRASMSHFGFRLQAVFGGMAKSIRAWFRAEIGSSFNTLRNKSQMSGIPTLTEQRA